MEVSATTVDEYIAGLKSPQTEIVRRLRRLVQEAVPDAVESIKWRMPVYEQSGLLCYIAAAKEHVRFGFYRGAELGDPAGVLDEGSGKGKHIRLRTVEEIPKQELSVLIQAAAALNEQ